MKTNGYYTIKNGYLEYIPDIEGISLLNTEKNKKINKKTIILDILKELNKEKVNKEK